MKPYIFLLILALISLSCKKPKGNEEEPDLERPQISLLSSSPEGSTLEICGLPEDEVFNLSSSETLELELLFTDDKELSQYKIDIHHNFDCHGHRMAEPQGEPWYLVQIKNLEGKRQYITEKLLVPDNVAAGNYHMMIFCTDKEGNEALPLVHSLKVENKKDVIPPIFSLTSPVEGQEVEKGKTLTFEGTANDNYSLNNGRLEVYYYNSSEMEFTAVEEYFSPTAGTSTNFSADFTVPLSSATGAHDFLIRVYDSLNNYSEKKISIIFK